MASQKLPWLLSALWVWQATKKIAELAEGMPLLRGFVHVSTAYVNAHQPKGSHIEEDIYPLRHSSGQTLLHDSLAAELAGLPHAKAERKVRHSYRSSKQLSAHQSIGSFFITVCQWRL
jgi:hypothetical protein